MKRNFESADPLRRNGPRRSGRLSQGLRRPGSGPGSGPGSRPGGQPSLPGTPQSQSPSPLVSTQGVAPGPGQGAQSSFTPGIVPNAQLQPQQDDGQYSEFTLRCCTAEDLAETRYHMLKFVQPTNLRKDRPENVDPASQFVPPIRMHRKDPKMLQHLAGVSLNSPPDGAPGGDVDMPDADAGDNGDANNSGYAGAGASSEVKKEGGSTSTASGSGTGGSSASGSNYRRNANSNSGDGANTNASGSRDGTQPPEKKKKSRFFRRKKTHQVHGGEKYDAARKLRYEEYYPWVMEDFEGKNTWVSSYEAAQSDSYAVLVSDDNGFKLVPVEKWYRMTQSARHATLSLEDAEERMSSRNSHRDRWLMAHMQPSAAAADRVIHEAGGGLRTVVGAEEKPKYQLDEEVDYNDEELFQDDEGAPILDGPDEDQKEAEERIKREQRQANQLMGTEDADIDDLLGDDSRAQGGRVDKQGKKLKRYLRSLEKNQFYDSDDEANPYASDDNASDTDSDDGTAAASGLGKGSGLGHDASAADEELMHLPFSSFRKKTFTDLPSGLAVLQLPPDILAKFPKGAWNPSLKPRPAIAAAFEAGGSGHRRTESEAIAAASSPGHRSPRSPARSPEPELEIPAGHDPAMVLTEDDIRKNIVSGETIMKELVGKLRDKLRVYPELNKARLRTILKRVARSRDGKLYLN